jgi:hypothetical protein
MKDLVSVDIIALFFYFLDYISLCQFLATDSFLWGLQEDKAILPFLERCKTNFIISTISEWWKKPAWIRIDLIGSFYKQRFGDIERAKIQRPIRLDGKPSGIFGSIVSFLELHPEIFLVEGGKTNCVAWNLTLGPAEDKYTCIFFQEAKAPWASAVWEKG